jgi:NADH-quinone oxidoreductase subunit A
MLSLKKKEGPGNGGTKSYACGEDAATNLVQPDYGQFFPFAFFFTILHVMTLMVTSAPVIDPQSIALAVFYVIGAVAALFILFRS